MCPRHSLSSGGNQLHPDPKVVGARGGTRAVWHRGGGTLELGQVPREGEGEPSAWVLTVPGDRQAWRPRECEAQLHFFEPGPPPFSAWTALAPHSPS